MMTNGERGMHLSRRPLADAERERLRDEAEDLRARARRARSAPWAVVSGGILVLYVLTLLASDASPLYISLFWLLFGTGLFVWVRRDFFRDARAIDASAAFLESALARGEADVIAVNAVAYAEFEEVEDEGACWAFDLGDDRVLFLRGQEYYRDEEFPCREFSVVQALAESGVAALEWIETHAPPSPPDRVIPAERKGELAARLPEHLGIVRASLSELEERLT